jgi:hypothetical protein
MTVRNEAGLKALIRGARFSRAGEKALLDFAESAHLTEALDRESQIIVADEDFLLASSGTLPAPWTKTIVGAGPPTGDYADDAIGGEYVFTTQATDQLQSVTLSFGDQLVIDPTKAPIIEGRFKIAPAGANFTADERLVFGLASARNATLDSITQHAWFRMEGANLNILVEADDGTTDTNDQDTLIDYVKSAYTVFKIDMTDTGDIKFTVDGVEQGGAKVAAAALTASHKMQPFMEIQRDAGTEVNVVTIDYITVTQNRS